jgi:glycopeptide antibiotics resistance protein
LWAAIALGAFTIYGSLLPFNFTSRAIDDARASFQEITFYPTADLAPRGDWVISTVQYGLLSFICLAAIAVDRPPWVGYLGALFVLAASVAFAIAIEFAQLFFSPRTVSLNDILAESIGAFLGVVGWLMAGRGITRWVRRLSVVFSLKVLARRLLPGYLAALFIVHLMPFDFVVGQNELAVKWTEGKINLVPFLSLSTPEAIGKLLLTIVSFIPVGLLSALAVRGSQNQVPTLPWQTFLLPPLIEFGQLLVYSRSFDVTDLLTGSLGIAVGGRLAHQLQTVLHSPQYVKPASTKGFSISILWPALLFAWGAIVVYLYWRPFDFTSDPAAFAGDPEEMSLYGLRRMSLAPFVDYYWGSKYSALDNFVRKALAFFPLGVLIALRERTLFQPWSTTRLITMAAVLAIGLEVGRYFLPSHAPSTTDVLIFTAGAWLGFQTTQLVRAVIWSEINSLPLQT